MDELVEDLLTYSKANSQDLKLSIFNIQELVEEVISNFIVEIKRMKISVELKNCEIELVADRIKIKQVFQNIISNSIKFGSEDGEASISINCSASNEFTSFTIKDTGIGVADEYKDNVLKEFKQLHPRKYEGTGMGLSIIKNIINRHNGTLKLMDNTPRGLIVEFTIPKKLEQSNKPIEL
jgi:signal transduction histidine kinase